jgi:hypothetical protein
LVATRDGKLTIYDAATLDEKSTLQPEGKNMPRQASASPDGRWFAVVFHHGRLWLHDAKRPEWQRAQVAEQGDISTVLMTDKSLLVAHQSAAITEYDWNSFKPIRRLRPPLTLTDWAYRYGIMPAYTIFPKPGEFYKTVQYLLTDQETSGDDEENIEAAQQKLNPWSPVWSSAAFIVTMLVICCVYIERQEF